MKVFCTRCGRGDFPETEEHGVDSTARDHLRIWHPQEWFSVEMENGVLVLRPKETA